MSNNNGKLVFPYASLDQAIQDKYAKIGGPIEAFRCLVNGYKGNIWRAKAGAKHKDEVKAALKFMREHEAAMGGTKAERQLRDAKVK